MQYQIQYYVNGILTSRTFHGESEYEQVFNMFVANLEDVGHTIEHINDSLLTDAPFMIYVLSNGVNRIDLTLLPN